MVALGSNISQHFPSPRPSFHPGASETERRLHRKLFENYNLKVRPARYWEERVMVRVGMTLSQLVSLVNINAGVQNHANICVCMYIFIHPTSPMSLLSATEWKERGDDDQRVHESGMGSATSIFISGPRSAALTPISSPSLSASLLLCRSASQMDLSLLITKKLIPCFISRLLWLTRPCLSLAPAN